MWRECCEGACDRCLGLVDRSDKVLVGTTEGVVKVRVVNRMPAGQGGDAACAKSIRGVP